MPKSRRPEPDWIVEDLVLAIHNRQIVEHGGGTGLRDSGLLSSALERPKNLYYYAGKDIKLEALAASYAFGLSRNHPFVDGNKRTDFVVSLTFLALNGIEVRAPQSEKYRVFLNLAAGKLTEAELSNWLGQNMVAHK